MCIALTLLSLFKKAVPDLPNTIYGMIQQFRIAYFVDDIRMNFTVKQYNFNLSDIK
jgi:hypothetical protein